MKIADRWFEGLLCKDISVTNEVYAVHNIEFDRQVFFAFDFFSINLTRMFVHTHVFKSVSRVESTRYRLGD
jgi:hypothetical protein